MYVILYCATDEQKEAMKQRYRRDAAANPLPSEPVRSFDVTLDDGTVLKGRVVTRQAFDGDPETERPISPIIQCRGPFATDEEAWAWGEVNLPPEEWRPSTSDPTIMGHSVPWTVIRVDDTADDWLRL